MVIFQLYNKDVEGNWQTDTLHEPGSCAGRPAANVLMSET